MSAIKNGGPAFPSHGSMGEVTHEGMTLRDYFATTSGVTWQDALIVVNRSGEKASVSLVAATLASMRLHVADAMLRAREAS